MTIFDFLNTTPDDLEEVLRGGSMFTGGKNRIFALYHVEKDARKRAKWLAKEYGIGGRSIYFPDERRGFVNYDAKGVRIDGFNFEGEQKYTWKEADTAIKKLIDTGRYMTEKDMESWDRLEISMDNIPYPKPAYIYPDIKEDEDGAT